MPAFVLSLNSLSSFPVITCPCKALCLIILNSFHFFPPFSLTVAGRGSQVNHNELLISVIISSMPDSPAGVELHEIYFIHCYKVVHHKHSIWYVVALIKLFLNEQMNEFTEQHAFSNSNHVRYCAGCQGSTAE